MRSKIKVYYQSSLIRIVLVAAMLSACDTLLDVEPPTSRIDASELFKDDVMATSAVTGIYAQLISSESFSSGSNKSITSLAALSADEFANYLPTNTSAVEFYNNSLNSKNVEVLGLWTSLYQVIYSANSSIEGLRNSTGLSSTLRDQLLGEALFVRAFCYFNLVNLFGKVPLVISTDYRSNTNLKREEVEVIYNSVLRDLLEAKSLMSEAYPTPQRVRPNRATAMALLARVYLYRQDWINAEREATQIIDNSIYLIEADLNNVFVSSSKEAIWQLRPTSTSLNTWEGNYFIINSLPNYSYLTNSLVTSFEDGDLRATKWINSFATTTEVFLYPFKYKIKFGGTASSPPVGLTEYSMVFRLAELYLIRAEARANLDILQGAIEDVDVLRARAQLPLIGDVTPGISSQDLLLAIEDERRHELFTEWGHRWYDLKRTGRADIIFASLKNGWGTSDGLYPIPEIEFSRNPLLKTQNPGY
jgi:hypothetical protein